MSDSPYFSLVLPCRNQADHIRDVLTRYASPLQKTGCSYELIVVPNASTDATADVVREVARQDQRIRVEENPAGGWGLSVLTGLKAARGAVLAYTNSARTDPANVPILLDLYKKNAPCLAKVRRIQRHAPLREIGSFLYNLEGKLLFGLSAADVNGTPKIFSRDLFQRAQLESPGDLLDLELMAQARRLGVPIVELPVAGFKRHGGRSSTNFASAWNMYAGAVALRRQLGKRTTGKAA
jgi:glycosyltransferase involved in cell wall biosynthesis